MISSDPTSVYIYICIYIRDACIISRRARDARRHKTSSRALLCIRGSSVLARNFARATSRGAEKIARCIALTTRHFLDCTRARARVVCACERGGSGGKCMRERKRMLKGRGRGRLLFKLALGARGSFFALSRRDEDEFFRLFLFSS